jgi:zinc protease
MSTLALPNGLRAVVIRDPSASEVQVTMRYRVGSVDDPAGQEGIAHLVEHLMLLDLIVGSESTSARLERIATYFNAFTSLDATTYIARAAPDQLGPLLTMEAARLGFRCTAVNDSVFARERQVVINELRQRGESRAIYSALLKAVYPEGHPFGRDFDNEATVSAISREQACAFAASHYTPGNAVLVVSGAVEVSDVERELRKLIARLPRTAAAPTTAIPVVAAERRHVEAAVPIDEDAVLVMWPLPTDPLLRIRARAIAPTLAGVVDAGIRGRARPVELGDGNAAMIGVAALPARAEGVDHLIRTVQRATEVLPRGLDRLHGTLGEIAFDELQQSAIYNLFASLEDGSTRDTRLARWILDGLDPREALAAEFGGLREMSPSNAAHIAQTTFAFARATIVHLKSTGDQKRGRTELSLNEPIHDLGQRRDPPDADEAHRPAASPLPHDFDIGARVLPNGMHVVLLPTASVPTVDIRLVFRAGTADEPKTKRGAALVAGNALTWDVRYLNDLLLFAAAGGNGSVDVESDRTTFSARGLDMHLDILLAGLRRWVREGRYDRDARTIVNAMRRTSKQVDDEGAFTDAWRAGVFGALHPYTTAGLVRATSRALSVADAEQFRAAHYTPDNATLVIAGHFDRVLADRWINYLFDDWNGHAEPRTAPSSSLQALSIAKVESTNQVHIYAGLSATAGDRASQLVAAEMLRALANEVRHQLGASYGFSVQLAESRLATRYVLTGAVDASRTRDALALMTSGLERWRSDPTAAARAFVAARGRVLVELSARTSSATVLAARIENDVELGRAPLADLTTARDVQALTIDRAMPSIAEIDLSKALVAMRGPRDELERAFAALGRQPTYVHADVVDEEDPLAHDEPESGFVQHRDDSTSLSDIEPALTTQRPAGSPWGFAVAASYGTGTFASVGVSGPVFLANVGHRFDRHDSFGIQLSVGSLSGPNGLAVTPFEADVFIQAVALDRLWGAILVGVHADSSNMTTGNVGLGTGVQVGVDVVKLRGHRLGVTASALAETNGYTLYSVGLAYRR